MPDKLIRDSNLEKITNLFHDEDFFDLFAFFVFKVSDIINCHNVDDFIIKNLEKLLGNKKIFFFTDVNQFNNLKNNVEINPGMKSQTEIFIYRSSELHGKKLSNIKNIVNRIRNSFAHGNFYVKTVYKTKVLFMKDENIIKFGANETMKSVFYLTTIIELMNLLKKAINSKK